jgi:hypothetical protein
MDADQEPAIQAFDQQLYAIAQQVKWWRPDILEPNILRLGKLIKIRSPHLVPIFYRLFCKRRMQNNL